MGDWWCLDGVEQCWSPTNKLNIKELYGSAQAGTFFLLVGIM